MLVTFLLANICDRRLLDVRRWIKYVNFITNLYRTRILLIQRKKYFVNSAVVGDHLFPQQIQPATSCTCYFWEIF